METSWEVVKREALNTLGFQDKYFNKNSLKVQKWCFRGKIIHRGLEIKVLSQNWGISLNWGICKQPLLESVFEAQY